MSNSTRPTILGRIAPGKTTVGKTRVCPHCKATILDSASICPACRRYLRFDASTEPQPVASLCPLRVAGTIVHPGTEEPWEYSVVLAVRNERGEEITRQVVGVGTLQATEQRTFNLAVEVFCSNPPKKK